MEKFGLYYDIFDRKVGKYEGKITFCGRTRQKHDKNMKKQQEDKKEIERKIEEENKKVMENENKIENDINYEFEYDQTLEDE